MGLFILTILIGIVVLRYGVECGRKNPEDPWTKMRESATSVLRDSWNKLCAQFKKKKPQERE